MDINRAHRSLNVLDLEISTLITSHQNILPAPLLVVWLAANRTTQYIDGIRAKTILHGSISCKMQKYSVQGK